MTFNGSEWPRTHPRVRRGYVLSFTLMEADEICSIFSPLKDETGVPYLRYVPLSSREPKTSRAARDGRVALSFCSSTLARLPGGY